MDGFTFYKLYEHSKADYHTLLFEKASDNSLDFLTFFTFQLTLNDVNEEMCFICY
jgi:hypothetical protein